MQKARVGGREGRRLDRQGVKTSAHHAWERADLQLAALVFGLALVVRILYLIQLRGSPAFEIPIIDSMSYDKQAAQIASGGPDDRHAFWQPPLYPYFLATIYALFGHSVPLARFVQGVLGSFNCVLLFFLGTRLFGRRAGLIAGVAMALYGPIVFFDGELLAPVLSTTLNLIALILLVRATDGGRKAEWFGAGLALGLSAITWPSVLAFAPAVLVLHFVRTMLGSRPVRHPKSIRRFITESALFVIAILIPIAIVTIRNAKVAGEFVPISTNGGINYYIGNNPDMEETRDIRPGYDWSRFIQIPRNEARALEASEASDWYYRKSFKWAAAAPGKFLLLQLHKFREFWVSYEIKRNQDLYYNTVHSWVLRVLAFRVGPWGFPFGVVGALGLAGALVLLKDRRATLLLLFLGTQVIAVAAFFVSDRYRLPVIPILLVFGAVWVTRAIEAARAPRADTLLRLAAPPLLFGLLIGIAGRAPAGKSEAETLLFVGEAKQELGDNKGAERLLRQAIAFDPNLPSAHFQLGSVLSGDPNRSREAEEEFRRCLALDPGHVGARIRLGSCLILSHRLDEAVSEIQRALDKDPFEETGRYFLGFALGEKGDKEGAIRELYRAIEIEPRYVDPYFPLAQLILTERRDPAQAIDLLREAIKLDPNHRQASAARELIRRLSTVTAPR